MKKIIAILLALVMVLGLAGCTNGKYASYKLGDVYSLSNVLKEVPYKLGYWDASEEVWAANRLIKSLYDVAAFEQNECIIDMDSVLRFGDIPVGPSVDFELDYYLKGKSVSDLNAIVTIYFNEILKHENVETYNCWFEDDGGLCYKLVMNQEGDAATDKVYCASIGASTYSSDTQGYTDHPYLYVWIAETDNESAYDWWSGPSY